MKGCYWPNGYLCDVRCGGRVREKGLREVESSVMYGGRELSVDIDGNVVDCVRSCFKNLKRMSCYFFIFCPR